MSSSCASTSSENLRRHRLNRFSHTPSRYAWLAGAACACFAAGTGALAQVPAPGAAQPTTVPLYQMPRPDYDPAGIRLDTFLLLPTLSEQFGYDDNIFA